MTNILIPTDFSTASVAMAHQALQEVNVNGVNIVFFHLFELPSSEFELLDPFRRKPYATAFTDSFRQACKQLKEQYPKAIQKVCFKFLEGNSAPLFRNFVDANEIDLIYCPEHFVYTPVDKMSVDPRPVFKKSGVTIISKKMAEEHVFETTTVLQPSAVLVPVTN